jgi:hypothetical protein
MTPVLGRCVWAVATALPLAVAVNGVVVGLELRRGHSEALIVLRPWAAAVLPAQLWRHRLLLVDAPALGLTLARGTELHARAAHVTVTTEGDDTSPSRMLTVHRHLVRGAVLWRSGSPTRSKPP